jgi:hypothetical protein
MEKYFVIDYKFSLINYRHASFFYNDDKDLGEQLRPAHEHYFEELLRLAAIQLYEKNKKTGAEKIDNVVKISTNSWELGKRLKVNGRTIRNYNTRLEAAGILVKQYRGNDKNYILHLNPFIVPIFDRNDLSGVPELFQKNEIASNFAKKLGRKSLPILLYEDLQRHFNKQLTEKVSFNNQIDENKAISKVKGIQTIGSIISSNFDLEKSPSNDITFTNFNTLNDYCKMLVCFGYGNAKTYLDTYNDICNDTGNSCGAEPTKKAEGGAPAATSLIETPTQPAATPETRETSTKKGILKKLQKKMNDNHIAVYRSGNVEELRYLFAYLLYQYAIEKIHGWRDRVYSGVTEEVMIYIAENYFKHCKSKAEMEQWLELYQRTVNASARYINKKIYAKHWKDYHVFPATYFDIKYTSGFYRYAKMQIEKYKAAQDKKEWLNRHKNRLETNQKLNKILLEYFLTPTRDNYYQLLERVKSTIPTRQKQFENCVRNQIPQIENYWKKQQKTA